MAIRMGVEEYVGYLTAAGEEIAGQKDYITALDSKTGDGDHWVNMNMGFQKIVAKADDLKKQDLPGLLKQVGMITMSGVGGSSGVLYGSAYIAASRALDGQTEIDDQRLLTLLEAQTKAIMERGKVEPGWKTMLDSLYQGTEAYRAALAAGKDSQQAVEALMEGARQGRDATRDMEAVKGRASYQTNKGVGDLDPGAVTMCMQVETLGRYILAHCMN